MRQNQTQIRPAQIRQMCTRLALALLVLLSAASLRAQYTISVAAGTGRTGFSGEGGPALQANLTPRGVAIDSGGNLYIADGGANRIRKVTPGGTISSIAGGGNTFPTTGLNASQILLGNLGGIVTDSSGNVYFADNAVPVKLTPAGLVSVPVTNPSAAVALDQAGNLYSTDGFAQVIKISPTGTVTTVAGTGSLGYSGDNGPAV